MEYENKPFSVYIKTDDQGRVIAINSDAFLPSTDGWLKIDQGFGDKYHHAQGNYLPASLTDDRGVYRWKLEGGRPVERTQEEMDADYTQPEDVPATDAGNLAAEVAALRESNAQLQEALELLLSGEVV